MRSNRLLILCTLLAVGLSLPGLARHPFWDDEASTAVIGRNFLKTGALTAWDGRNLLSYSMRGEIDAEMRKEAPPLQYLIAAAGMALFGENTAGARSLFWLLGLLAVPLVALWLRDRLGPGSAWIAAFLLASSVPFLLFIRQARYFGPSLAFSLGLLATWAQIARSRRPATWILAGVAMAALLCLTDYLSALAVGSVIVASLVERPYRCRRNLAFLAVLGLFGIAAALAFGSGTRGTAPAGFAGPISFVGRMVRLAHLLPMSLRDLVRFELAPAGALLFCLPALLARRPEALPRLRAIGALLLCSLGAAVAVSLFNPQPLRGLGSDTHVRYHLLQIPIWIGIAASVFELLRATGSRRLSTLFLAAFLFSNAMSFNFLGSPGLHCRLWQHVEENLADYPTGTDAAGAYIAAKVGVDECLFMVPLYTNVEQLFYHPEQRFCGLVSEKARFVAQNRARLRDDLFFERAIPDVFIVGGWSDDRFQRLLDRLYGPGAFRLAEMLPVYWRNATRPEMLWRSFGPVDVGISSKNRILIFRRTGAPAHPPQADAFEIGRQLMY